MASRPGRRQRITALGIGLERRVYPDEDLRHRINGHNFLRKQRLPGEIVTAVEVDDGITVFPLGAIGDGAVNAEVGGLPVVVFTTSGGRSVGAFSRVPVPSATEGRTLGRTLTFEYREGDGREEDAVFVDRETGSTWDFAGRAQEGPLAGSRLDWVSTRRSLWFAVAISFPGVDIYNP